MKTVIKGKILETQVLVINNSNNEIMISEASDGSFIITQTYEGDEVVVGYIYPTDRIEENIEQSHR